MRPYITDIWGWDPKWQKNDFSTHFEPEHISLVIADNQAVGYCQIEDQGQQLLIRMLLLVPEYQRQGIGTRLLNNVIQSAKAQSKSIKLYVFKRNLSARAFYERHGFRIENETSNSFIMGLRPDSQR